MKKISLADLLVLLKQYKGQMSAWHTRLQVANDLNAKDTSEYDSQVSYPFKECMAAINKLGKYLTYLKGLRNDASQENIKLSYQIAELKSTNAVLGRLNVNHTYQQYINREYVSIKRYVPISQKEIDEIVEKNQIEINVIQSKITAYNNQTFIEVQDYEAFDAE